MGPTSISPVRYFTGRHDPELLQCAAYTFQIRRAITHYGAGSTYPMNEL